MKKILLPLFITLLLFCQSAHGLELKDAKTQGLVGETTTGYLAAVSSPTPEVKKLLDTINAKRKTHYQGIAKKNKTSLQSVEQLAGKKAMSKTLPGQFINSGAGWKKK